MKHRASLANGRSEVFYVVHLEGQDRAWRARWHTEDGNARVVESGPSGNMEGDDGEMLLDRVRDLLDEADEDVVGVDWEFDAPVPSWLE